MSRPEIRFAPLAPAQPPKGGGGEYDASDLPVRGAAGNAGNTALSQLGDARAAGAPAPKSVSNPGSPTIDAISVTISPT